MRLTICDQWTIPAAWTRARTECRTEIHHRLRVIRNACRRRIAFRTGPELLQHPRLSRPACDGVEPRKHAFDIAIENRVALIAGQGQNGARRRATHTGQILHDIEVFREDACVYITNLAGRLVQITAARVIAQPRPQMQHRIYVGICQTDHVRETRHEALEIRYHRRNLGLLQHHLGYPDPIGRAIHLPRQVFATVCVIPLQHHRRELPRVRG